MFYSAIICAAEKPAHSLGRVSYAAATRLAINRDNGAGPAESDQEMEGFRRNEREASGTATCKSVRQYQMKRDDWGEGRVASVKGATHKYADVFSPRHLITADGKWYEISAKQWEQYSHGKITWEDLVVLVRAFAAAKR